MPPETADGRGIVNIYDDEHDPRGWRRERLRRFLSVPRDGYPLVLFVGISPGEKGAAVSGVGFSSRRTLMEAQDPRLKSVGEGTEWISMNGDGVALSEQTATNFWNEVGPAFEGSPLPVTWNVAPFWTYETKNCVRENRSKLLACEVELGKRFLIGILNLFQFDKVVAVGNEPASALRKHGIEHEKVYHPSYGHVGEFSEGIGVLIRELQL